MEVLESRDDLGGVEEGHGRGEVARSDCCNGAKISKCVVYFFFIPFGWWVVSYGHVVKFLPNGDHHGGVVHKEEDCDHNHMINDHSGGGEDYM